MLEKLGKIAKRTLKQLAKTVKRMLEFLRKLAEGDLDGARRALFLSTPFSEDAFELGLEEEERKTPGRGPGPKPGSPSLDSPFPAGPPEVAAEIVVGEEPPFSEIREEIREAIATEKATERRVRMEKKRQFEMEKKLEGSPFFEMRFLQYGGTHKRFPVGRGGFGEVFKEGRPVPYKRVYGENYWNTRPRIREVGREVGPQGEFPPVSPRFQSRAALVKDVADEVEARRGFHQRQARLFSDLTTAERERELHEAVSQAFAARTARRTGTRVWV